MGRPKTFKDWLYTQQGKDSPIGDLAKDVALDERVNKIVIGHSKRAIRFRASNLADIVDEAFAAYKEYKAKYRNK